MTDQESPKPKRRPEGRSPNFPSLSLEKAIDKAEKLDHHPIPITLLPSRWGYSNAKNSAFQQAVAALKAYGLINVDGAGNKRAISLSERGRRIIKNAPDRDAQVRAAALNPPVIRELWEKYAPYGALPKDDIIRNFLVWERDGKFLESSADTFIGILKDTISFAQLSPDDVGSDSSEGAESNGNEPEGPADDVSPPPPPRRKGKEMERHNPPPPPPGILSLPLPLGTGSAVLQVPEGIGEANFEKLKTKIGALLEVYREKIVGEAETLDD